MTVLLDTGIFVGFHNSRDMNHQRALELMRGVTEGEFGAPYTSDFIFDEAVTVSLVRTGRPDIVRTVGGMILGEITEPFLTLLRVSENEFNQAWSLFNRYADRGLSFTDCTSIALLKTRKIDAIISFDADFDGIAQRIS